ncbi:MAG TPA: hypothetical protein VF743_02245, partial [Acidimicrobiales bacterium]
MSDGVRPPGAYDEQPDRWVVGGHERPARTRPAADAAWVPPDGPPLGRFTAAERALHWTVAAAVLTCALTGLILY